MQKAGFSCPKVFRVPLTTFSKRASSPNDLLTKLQGQGLTVADQQKALYYLQYVGGYRLKGYWYHLVDPSTNRFPAGYDFDSIAARCEFDRELRSATIEAIDRLEVAIRSTIANYLSLSHGAHWFLDSRIFKPTTDWGLGQLLQKVESEVKRDKSKKRFVTHYFDNHDDPYLPPSWSISECVSFGLWSRTYEILRDPNDKKAISMKFAIDQPGVFKSWIHALTVLRNVVAHHGQLLKSKLGVAPSNYTSKGITFVNNKHFFAVATVIQYMLAQTNLPHRWKDDLRVIFAKYPSVNIVEIGFPQDWETASGW
ncbi:MAG: Abi family protein [Comamonas sp.]|uniref:Abi family protein n=1 Tax=Comamonas sp. TaxID=34028 RepID=UPI0028234706|nr:Abi family protein [Comamonas sp.]MDR0213246.1 Abi family protein [Comamonas sp.]